MHGSFAVSRKIDKEIILNPKARIKGVTTLDLSK
jgi:hypothetical protein